MLASLAPVRLRRGVVTRFPPFIKDFLSCHVSGLILVAFSSPQALHLCRNARPHADAGGTQRGKPPTCTGAWAWAHAASSQQRKVARCLSGAKQSGIIYPQKCICCRCCRASRPRADPHADLYRRCHQCRRVTGLGSARRPGARLVPSLPSVLLAIESHAAPCTEPGC